MNIVKEYLRIKTMKLLLVSVIIFSIMYSISNTLITTWISKIIDGYQQYLNPLIIATVVNIILDGAISYMSRVGKHNSYINLNKKFVDKLLSLDYSVYTKYGPGYIHSVYSSLVDIAGIGFTILTIFKSIASFMITTTAICRINILLIIPIAVIYSIGGIMLKILFGILLKIDKEARDAKFKRNDEVEKIIQGFAEVRSNCTEDYHRCRVDMLNKKVTSLFKNKRIYNTKITGMFQIIDGLITIIIVLYAIVMIPKGLSSATAMTLVLFAWRLLEPLVQIIYIMDTISESTASFEKYKEFMSIESKIKSDSIELKDFCNSIEFNNVSFSYDQSDLVLDNISFKIEKGQKIGICGCSGGGKSTIVKLIPRFYDVTSGAIKIDGLDIRKLTLKSLRNKIGMVHQNNYMFNGTILDNVNYGEKCHDMVAIVEACKKAHIYDFIISLPKSWQTDIGPKGLKLSGGQQQRIALARIFLRNPDIIILDEATSALDNETEKVVQESLELFKDKTIITIAHRLSTIKNSDKIILIDEHIIKEEGTHDELMKKQGIYYKLATSK